MATATEERATELELTVEDLQEYYTYLDNLRKSGVTNMFGAGTYLREMFGMSKPESHKILAAWMKDFGK